FADRLRRLEAAFIEGGADRFCALLHGGGAFRCMILVRHGIAPFGDKYSPVQYRGQTRGQTRYGDSVVASRLALRQVLPVERRKRRDQPIDAALADLVGE